jgi:hypothetical protein
MSRIQGSRGDAVRQRTLRNGNPLITPQVGYDRVSHGVNKMNLFYNYGPHLPKIYGKLIELKIYTTNPNA